MRRRRTRLAFALAVVSVTVAVAGCGGADGRSAKLRCATPRHPNPVVLLPGTYGVTSFATLSNALTARGYCVYEFDYGDDETGPIATSAQDLARFVDRVLARTHATHVALVGHSQGGLMARYYIRFDGGLDKVSDLVALAPPNHGTSSPLVIPGYVAGCVACAEQTAGSSLLSKVNGGDATPGPADYTVVETLYDGVVTPYTSAFLDGPSSQVTNVLLQEDCPSDLADHVGIASDPVAVQWVEEALGRNGPADASFHPRC